MGEHLLQYIMSKNPNACLLITKSTTSTVRLQMARLLQQDFCDRFSMHQSLSLASLDRTSRTSPGTPTMVFLRICFSGRVTVSWKNVVTLVLTIVCTCMYQWGTRTTKGLAPGIIARLRSQKYKSCFNHWLHWLALLWLNKVRSEWTHWKRRR